MSKRLTTFILVTLVLISGAAALEAQFTPINNVIGVDEQATFNLTVTNTASEEQTYRLSLGVDDSSAWILSPNSFTVSPNETRSTTVTVAPRSRTSTGSYFTRISLNSDGERRTLAAPISLGTKQNRGFVPNVGLTVTNEERIDPRDPLRLSFELDNRNQRDLDNLTVTANSDLFQESFTVDLGGLEQQGKNLFLTLDPTTPPGDYNVDANIYLNETKDPITSYNTEFTVVSYDDIIVDQDQDEGWFKTQYTTTITNNGNVERDYTYNVSAGLHERLFLSSPQNTSLGEQNGQAVQQWHLNIPSQESRTVSYERNYQGLVATILAIVLVIAAYFYFRSPVVARKEAKIIKNPDGADELKIQVFLRNRGNNTVYDVSVTDKLPSILEYKAYDDIGYISPTTVRKKRKGTTTIHWDIDELDPLEERILVYEATPRLEVLGEVDLPGVRAQFENEDGNVRVYESWTTSAGSDTEFLEQK